MNRGELVAELAAKLGARHEARFIVEDVLGPAGSRTDQGVSGADATAVRELADRRRSGEPLQYVLGHWAFRTLDLMVDPRVLIPRPETEQVVEVALSELRRAGVADPVMVDAGTGSGAIALSLATELAGDCPAGQVWAVDESGGALEVARANLDRVRTDRGGRVLPVTFLEGSWLAGLPGSLAGKVTLVVSNPPYVDATEWPDLPPEVRMEPPGALVAPTGNDGTPGLGDIEALLAQARDWLARPGALVVELAPHQAIAARSSADGLGYEDVRVAPDLSGRPRTLVGHWR